MNKSDRWTVAFAVSFLMLAPCAILDVEYGVPFMIPAGVGFGIMSILCYWQALESS
jgi:hypothetical protein